MLLLLLLLLQAERRLAEEVERVKNYLDESTEPKITRVAEHELITVQVRTRSGLHRKWLSVRWCLLGTQQRVEWVILCSGWLHKGGGQCVRHNRHRG
jgi:hypothetical protein